MSQSIDEGEKEGEGHEQGQDQRKAKKAIDQELVDALMASKLLIGEVNPIIVDYDGEILSGVHRKAAGWLRKHFVDSRELAKRWDVPPGMAKEIVRLHMNVQRKPSKEETKAIVLKMAKCLEESGMPKERIASELEKYVPYSRWYLWKLLPEEYKRPEKVEAGRASASASAGLSPAGGGASEAEAEAGAAVEEEEAKKPKIEAKILGGKAPETWEFREARMHPPVSRMEAEVVSELIAEGYSLETNREFCLEATRPDAYHAPTNTAIYIDGPAHRGREAEDERLRELLRKRYGCRVLALRYDEYSQSAKEEIKAAIKEALG